MKETAFASHVQPPSSQRAIVLIVVLWITVGFVSLVLLFGQSMMFEYRSADNNLAGLEAEQAIEGAVRYAQSILANAEEKGVLPELTTYQSEWAPVGNALFWFLGRDSESASSTQPIFGLVDECSKLNLNTATIEMLEKLPGMTAELAAAIVDWRDEDSEVSANGAESEAYMLRQPAYQCKNAPFETVDELHWVYGADWSILYGEDANRNGILDPNENDGSTSYPDDNQDGRLDSGILDYVTVYSRESNQGGESSSLINVAGDSQQELITLLQEKLGEERANEIQRNLSGQSSEIGSLLEFFIRSKMTLKEFALIAGEITATEEESREGLINVNTAPEAVLACIPGIGTEYASSLAAYRRSNPDNLDSVAWVSEVLEETNAIEAGPYLTAKSYQYTADVAAVGHAGKGYRRVQFVIDISGSEPAIRYRRDMTRFGWALGQTIRNELANLKEPNS